MLFSVSIRMTILAMWTLASAIPAHPDEMQVDNKRLLPRIVCPDARYKPCGTMCCTPLERCSYIELIGYACFDKDDSSSADSTEVELSTYTSTYTDPDLNTMLITAHDDTVTLTATTPEPDLSTIPISAHGNSSITAAPTSGIPTSGVSTIPTGSEAPAVSTTTTTTTTTRSTAGRVDFRGYEMVVFGLSVLGYFYLL